MVDMFYPERTAISRKRASVPAKHFIVDGPITDGIINSESPLSILDWGCGKGIDIDWLASVLNATVKGYDPYFKPHSLQEIQQTVFDYVICFYVLNVISTKKSRIKIIKQAAKYLALDGKMFIAVRSKQHIDYFAKNWQRYRDGYRTKKDTFQHGFTNEELKKLVKSAGLCYTSWSESKFVGCVAHY